jgi:hypothetical protein
MGALPDTTPGGTVEDQPAAPITGQPANRLRKRRVLVWILVAALVGAAGAGGVFAYSTVRALNVARASAASAIEAEQHWQAAAASLAAIDTVAYALDASHGSYSKADFDTWATLIARMQQTAAPELDAMAGSIAGLPDGPLRAGYTTVLERGRDGLKRADGAAPALPLLGDLYTKDAQATRLLDRARDRVNAAISSGNARKYDPERKSADLALADLASAERILKGMKPTLLNNDILAGATYVDSSLALVSRIRAMAAAAAGAGKAGKTGSIATFNSYVKRYNSAVAALNKFEDDRASAVDAGRFAERTVTAFDNARDLFEAAKAAHGKILAPSLAQ